MNLYVEHDAAHMAALTGAEKPACDTLIVRLGRPDDVLAAMVGGNPLDGTWLWDLELPGERVVAWSGTLGDDLFASHPRTWMAPGHEALAEFCDQLHNQLSENHRVLCFRPHSRHVLSDIQSTLTFALERHDEPFEFALDPTALLEPSMLDAIDDHLTRIIDTLGGRCAMVMLSDAQVSADGQSIEHVPLGEGELPRDLTRQLLDSCVPEQTPIVIRPEQLEAQRQWLGV